MKIEIRNVEDKTIVIFRPWSDLTIGSAKADLQEAIMEEINKQHTYIIVDLTDVRNSDVHAVTLLMECEKAARKNGGNIKLLHPPASMKKFLRDNNLGKVFGGVYDDEEAALQNFVQQK